MNTTSLFVELVVIGIGAGFWIILLVFAFFGYSWVPTDTAFSIMAAIPFLTTVYVLGIVSDRMIDKLFDKIWGNKLKLEYFANSSEAYEARRTVITSSDRMADIIEYNRSRLRICRGWAVHSIMIAIIIPIFAFMQLPSALATKVSIGGILLFIILGVSSYYAWKYLNHAQYLKVKEQAEFLSRGKK